MRLPARGRPTFVAESRSYASSALVPPDAASEPGAVRTDGTRIRR